MMWAGEFTAFLLGFGFTQSVVDGRLFYVHGKLGLVLMVGTFVEDSKLVVLSETMAAALSEGRKKKYRDPPDADAAARDFLGPKYVRATDGETETETNGYNKAFVDLEERLGDLIPRGPGAHCAVSLPPAALRQLEYGPGPDNVLMPVSILPRACSTLGFGGWILCHACPDAILGFVAISRHVSPGRLTEYALGRPIQCSGQGAWSTRMTSSSRCAIFRRGQTPRSFWTPPP